MSTFIPREKLSKKARKQLDKQQRTTWAFSPTTRRVESKKLYNRKRRNSEWGDSEVVPFSVCAALACL